MADATPAGLATSDRRSADRARPQRSGARSGERARLQRRSGAARWFGLLAALVLVIGAGAALLVAVLPVDDMVRRAAIDAVARETGRTLVIGGGASLVLASSAQGLGPQIVVDDVQLLPPDGMTGPATFAAEKVSVRVQLMPLLTGRVVLDEIVLLRPVVDLRIDGDGRASWAVRRRHSASAHDPSGTPVRLAQVLPSPSARTRTDALQPGAAAAAPSTAEATGAAPIAVAAVKIVDGAITYTDARRDYVEQVDGVSVRVSQAGGDLTRPLAFKGTVRWRDETVLAEGSIARPADLAAGGGSKVALAARSALAEFGLDGDVSFANGGRIQGPVRMAAPSFARAAGWLGFALPNAAPLGALDLTGQVVGDAQGARIEQAKLTVGDMTASGLVGVGRTAGAVGGGREAGRPLLVTDLTVANIDVDRIVAALDGAHLAARPVPTSVARPDAIGALLRGTTGKTPPAAAPGMRTPGLGAGRFSPQVRGFLKREGWSADPIDTRALMALDWKGRLALTGLQSGKIRFDELKLRGGLAAGLLDVTFDDIQLQGGRGAGALRVVPAPLDGASAALAITTRLTMDGVDLRPLWRKPGSGGMDGRSRVVVDVETRGGSEAQLMQAMQGRAELSVANGALIGWDAAAIINGLGRGEVPNSRPDPNQRTPFQVLRASFDIKGGTARTSDLMLDGPHITATGAGTISIAERQMSMMLRPRLSRAMLAPGSTVNLAALEVPLRISGPLDSPQIAFMPAAIAPRQAEKIGRKVREYVKDERARALIDDVTKKGINKETIGRAKTLLKNLLKR